MPLGYKMKNGLIHIDDLREMDKIAASMDEDYTLEDLIQGQSVKKNLLARIRLLLEQKQKRYVPRKEINSILNATIVSIKLIGINGTLNGIIAHFAGFQLFDGRRKINDCFRS